MWKLALGFIIFAGLALFILSKGGTSTWAAKSTGSIPTRQPLPPVLAMVAPPQHLRWPLPAPPHRHRLPRSDLTVTP